ncbi:hypothetical protein [Geodermatophilus sp. SYSU D01105]
MPYVNSGHVRVTEDEVAAAKLEIQLLQRLGRPVDPRLHVLANAEPVPADVTPVKSPPSESVAERVIESAIARSSQEKLPSVRAHVRKWRARHNADTRYWALTKRDVKGGMIVATRDGQVIEAFRILGESDIVRDVLENREAQETREAGMELPGL